MMVAGDSDSTREKDFTSESGEEEALGEGSPRPSSWREREKQHCRQEILAAASELFAQFGYERTAVKQIADKVGVSVGTLYSHFQGKEEMLRELLEQSIRELDAKGEEACRAGDPPLEQLRRRMTAAVGHFKGHMDFMMIYHNESPHSLEGMVRAEISRNIGIVSDLLGAAMDRGEMRRGDSDVLAAALVGSFHELMRMFADRGMRERFDDIPRIVDQLILEPLETGRRAEPGREEG